MNLQKWDSTLWLLKKVTHLGIRMNIFNRLNNHHNQHFDIHAISKILFCLLWQHVILSKQNIQNDDILNQHTTALAPHIYVKPTCMKPWSHVPIGLHSEPHPQQTGIFRLSYRVFSKHQDKLEDKKAEFFQLTFS